MREKYEIIGIRDRLMQEMHNNYLECEFTHACYNCVYGLMLIENGRCDDADLRGTHQDANACEYFYKDSMQQMTEWAADKDTGNTRVSMSGFRTKDNGGGYDILECPYRIDLE